MKLLRGEVLKKYVKMLNNNKSTMAVNRTRQRKQWATKGYQRRDIGVKKYNETKKYYLDYCKKTETAKTQEPHIMKSTGNIKN